MIKKMRLFYVVDNSDSNPNRSRGEVEAVAGPFYTWNDAADAKRKMDYSELLSIGELTAHVEVL
jgi:hypothetical protein